MRVIGEEVDFSSYLLTIGNGTANLPLEEGQDLIQIPEKFLVSSVDELIAKVFPTIEKGYTNRGFVSCRAILTPINDDVDKLNEIIMDRFPGESKTYLSADSITDGDLHGVYQTDYLNSLTVSGMPPHSMKLKVGAPVMLLRNLRAGPGNGLRNGTRMIISKLGEHIIEAEITSGITKGKKVLIPRITIIPSDTELPFVLRRRQFPIRPCFVMTTNKSQGQTLDFVGIYLPNAVFAHGQLYVAFSRVRKSSSLAIYMNSANGITKNIVYQEVL